MNNLNWEIMSHRTKQGQLKRNLHNRRIGLPLALLHTVVERPDQWPKWRASMNEKVREYPLPPRPATSPLDAETWCKLAEQPPLGLVQTQQTILA